MYQNFVSWLIFRLIFSVLEHKNSLNPKKISFSFSIIFVSVSLSAQVYYFESTNPGILCFSEMSFIDIPRENLFYTNGKYYCKPYHDDEDKKYYVYTDKRGVYQIGANLKKGNKLEIDSFRVTKNIDHVFLETKKIHDISDHFVHKYIPRSTLHEEELVIQEKPLNKKSSLFIDLYNPTRNSSPITLSIGTSKIDTTLAAYQKIRISASVNTSTNKKLDLSVLAMKAPVCIVQYGISNKNTVFFPDSEFSTHVYDNPSYLNKKYFIKRIKLNEEYQFFHIEKGELKKLSPQKKSERFKNLIFVKNSAIKEPVLKNAKEIDTAAYDFLVVYDSQFQHNIKDIRSIIKSIDQEATIFSIDAQDIYNFYSNGQPSEQAIKKYLYKTKPQNLLLIGNPDNSKNKEIGYIPTFTYKQYETGSIYVSDYAYCYFDNPYEPSIAVGRLPFRSEIYLKNYIKKVRLYLDRADNFNSTMLIDEDIIPKGKKSELLKKDDDSSDIDVTYKFFEKLITNDIIKDINNFHGDNLIHTGHGSITGWGRKGQIDNSDFEKIDDDRFFKLFDMSCWTGLYNYHDKECFAEELLKNKSGAISVVASSKRTPTSIYLPIFKELTENGNEKTIGILLNEVKRKLLEQGKVDIHDIHSFNLLGIPSLPY